MTILIFLLASFGLTFGFQNKVPYLHTLATGGDAAWRKFLQGLLACPYCLGFWTGWVTWFASWLFLGHPILETSVVSPLVIHVVGGVVWSFASTVFCYLMYVAIVWLEDSLEK